MKTLYLHVGTPKTGTCAIQELCTLNQGLLNSQGYCYPEFTYSYPGFGKRRNAVFLQRPIWKDGVRQPEQEKQRFLEGMDIIRKHFETYDNVILSDEGVWGSSCENRKSIWPELKEYSDAHQFSVKIIVYLRRQDLFIDSFWRQRVKGSRNKRSKIVLSWDEYVKDCPETSYLDYYAELEKLSSFFGKENIIVRRFDRNYFPNGMIQADFLEMIGLKLTDEYVITHQSVNVSMSGNICEIKRVINLLPDITDSEYFFLRKNLIDINGVSGSEYKSNMFSAQETEAFMETYRQDNRKIAEEYLNEKDTDLFDMDFSGICKWEKGNPYLLDDIIRFATATNLNILRKMGKENAALRQELDGLKSKLRHPFRTFIRIVLKKLNIR